MDGVSTGGGPSGLGPWVLGIERASERDDAMDAAAARLQETLEAERRDSMTGYGE